MKITREVLLMGRDEEYPTTEEIEVNIARLLFRVNSFLKALGPDYQNLKVTSGYRPGKYNLMARGAPNSSHLTGEAIDLGYTGPSIIERITDKDLLTVYNLYMEDPTATPGWIHLQTRPTKSGKRIFKP